ncbi:hypothetical protein IEO21_09672 [Rhodonia placenta]|uniref:Uncharacterized protein n=1 Tax=Rhodonia placenta TaxID=104341 RepID=A0A8H7TXI1_9APHY|nr:hypothetical protein IEO21_09672 [Postia placenta]
MFKGPADHSGYGALELHDKYLSRIPSHCATEVEQQLDISRACWFKLNKFFLALGGAYSEACGGASRSQGASASINATLEKATSLAIAMAVGRKGTVASSTLTLRTSLTPNVLKRGLQLPWVPPRLQQVPPSLHPHQVQVPLQQNQSNLSWWT